MALKWIEGFEGFGTAGAPSGLDRKYLTVISSDMEVVAGRVGGFAIQAGTTGPPGITTPGLGNLSTVIVGFAWRPGTAIGNAHNLIDLIESATQGVNLRVKTDGEFEIYRGATLLDTTVGAAIASNTWAYIELKVVVALAGSYELRINGVTVLSGSADTQVVGTAQNVRFYWNSSTTAANATTYDDIYICDGSGAENNDFLGIMKVKAFYPEAEGTTIAWTPSAGADNSLLVDENPANSDTDYVESATTGQKDLYAYQAVSGFSGIKGVQINTTVRVTDVNPFDILQVVRSNLTESDGAAWNITSTNYADITRILEQDPDTLAAWTEAGLSAAEFGVKVG